VRAGVLIGAVLLLVSCGSTSGGSRPVGALSAQGAVTGYLEALDTHDPAAARAYLAPEYQKDRAMAIPPFDSWVANIVSVRLRSMPPGTDGAGMEAQFPGYRDLIEFGPTYDAVFRTQSLFATTGPQTEFFIVGRSRAHNTWLILSIGSGP
jgi:hypothetical protein